MKLIKGLFCLSLFLIASQAMAATVKVPIYLTAAKGKGTSVGCVVASDTPYGLLLTPKLSGLPPGEHGFHVHTNPDCGQAGKAAGGHFDPANTKKHKGPYHSKGHLGDLPVMTVNASRQASTPLLAPRLTVAKIKGHSLIIHLYGDNYSDSPKPLGGGGSRMACGIIPK